MITIAVSTPAPAPRPFHVRLAYEIVAINGGCDTPAELVERVESWGREEWSQVFIDHTVPTPTGDQQAKALDILRARARVS